MATGKDLCPHGNVKAVCEACLSQKQFSIAYDKAKSYPGLPHTSDVRSEFTLRRIVRDAHTKQLIDAEYNLHDNTKEHLFRDVPDGPRDILVTWFYSTTPVLKPGTFPIVDTSGESPPQAVDDKIPDLVDDVSETPEGTSPPPQSIDDAAGKDTSDIPENLDTCPPCTPISKDQKSSEEYLRILAKTTYHCMTHKPFNPFCKLCVMNKTRAKAHKRGAFKRIVEKFGDLITGDHIEWDKNSKAINYFQRTLLLYDVATKFRRAEPQQREDANACRWAISAFCGDERIKLFYGDNQYGVSSALKEVDIHAEYSCPADPTNNALAENRVQDTKNSVRTLLQAAGMPHCMWPYAVRFYCMAENARKLREFNDTSPYFQRFGEEPDWQEIPF